MFEPVSEKEIREFRNNNPDKGTETVFRSFCYRLKAFCLEIITPIRGRKLLKNVIYVMS